jgi:hypothetical protein
MLDQNMNAGSTSVLVASQFNREYRRMFGASTDQLLGTFAENSSIYSVTRAS